MTQDPLSNTLRLYNLRLVNKKGKEYVDNSKLDRPFQRVQKNGVEKKIPLKPLNLTYFSEELWTLSQLGQLQLMDIAHQSTNDKLKMRLFLPLVSNWEKYDSKYQGMLLTLLGGIQDSNCKDNCILTLILTLPPSNDEHQNKLIQLASTLQDDDFKRIAIATITERSSSLNHEPINQLMQLVSTIQDDRQKSV